jgi:hypothetical protein
MSCLANGSVVGYRNHPQHPSIVMKGAIMTVAKVIEITSSSKKSFDDAVSSGIARASETIADIQGAWVKDQKVVVNKGKVTEYRVTMKVTFVLADAKATASAKKK